MSSAVGTHLLVSSLHGRIIICKHPATCQDTHGCKAPFVVNHDDASRQWHSLRGMQRKLGWCWPTTAVARWGGCATACPDTQTPSSTEEPLSPPTRVGGAGGGQGCAVSVMAWWRGGMVAPSYSRMHTCACSGLALSGCIACALTSPGLPAHMFLQIGGR